MVFVRLSQRIITKSEQYYRGRLSDKCTAREVFPNLSAAEGRLQSGKTTSRIGWGGSSKILATAVIEYEDDTDMCNKRKK